MNIAIIGCGFVADFYMATLRHYTDFKIIGAYDRDRSRLDAFCNHFGVRRFGSREEVLGNEQVEMVLNLTNPRSHFEITEACLLAGKHVYSEKPLAMKWAQAAELAGLAKQRRLGLATAPSSMLSATCQTMWRALDEGAIGRVRLVYASLDAGMTRRTNPCRWRSVSGAPWPAKDEYETGCTYEHGPYVLSWLAAFFGPARRVTAFASCRVPDKGIHLDTNAPDFSVGCIEYDNDVVARVTFSLVAPTDRSIMIIGDNGVLHAKNVRDDASPVTITRTPPNRLATGIRARLHRLANRVEHRLALPWSVSIPRAERRLPFAIRPRYFSSGRNKPVDFMTGPHELAQSIREGRACRLSPELGVHITELIEALQYPERFDRTPALCTSFEPIAPLTWTE